MISFYSLNKLQSEKQEKIQILKKQFKFSKKSHPKRPTKKPQNKKGFIRKLLTIQSILPKKKKIS